MSVVDFRRVLRLVILLISVLGLLSLPAVSETAIAGPYIAHIVEGGPELSKPIQQEIASSGAWSEWVWVRIGPDGSKTSVIARIGAVDDKAPRVLMIRSAHPAARIADKEIVASAAIDSMTWHLIGVVEDGNDLTLYVDGLPAGTSTVSNEPVTPELLLAPTAPTNMRHFSGDIGGLSIASRAFSPAEMMNLFVRRPDFNSQLPEENAKPWRLQTRQRVGYEAPQPPDSMPHGFPAEKPRAKPLPAPGPTLRAEGKQAWTIANNWRLLSVEDDRIAKSADGPAFSTVGFDDASWMLATVPGTVLTTMIDRGIYPDPDFGLNNLAIPESLNKHDYWYRVEFPSPKLHNASRRTLHFAGINYSAEVWLNGVCLGQMRGAFRRGDFDVTSVLRKTGINALAIRISPPPHPGIPQEQSLKGGPGDNGGAMLIDGPTFVATEGWDWVPAIRDRDTGLWQNVSLTESGAITIGDPQVITRLPLPDNTTANIEIHVPVHNATDVSQHIVLEVAFEGVALRMPAVVHPGNSTLSLLPGQFLKLHLMHPRLWWPNGYGSPELYHLHLAIVDAKGNISDTHSTTFGIRELSYELTLFDHSGRLERIEAIPTLTLDKGYDAVDVHHEAMRQTANGWASSISREAEGTSAIREVTNEPEMTDLVIKVNGVRIAVRGGNWGMDDSRKRVSRSRLEPYFRLHREANLNMVRNWVGQDTEETFFDLADEYGMLVWNDFWSSTQNSNAEPGDVSLFMENARDVVRRDRNHPSIAIWCGRNEGVPPPALNSQMITMLRKEDGTRFYSPSSNVINLRKSGPYSWQDPALYFSKLNRGFSVELGIASFPTREAFEHTVASQDRWPVSDAWAYHDWHQSGGGDVHTLIRHMDIQFGKSESLQDFERRIQMFNYVDHKAIFEGFYQHLWEPNSGRMLWMTHPAWPSTMWQIYSSDYDTQASFYAVKKANAPLHIQMDLSDYTVAIVNTTLAARSALQVVATIYSPQGQVLRQIDGSVSVLANSTAAWTRLPLVSIFNRTPLVFVRLEMKDQSGNLLADNIYWTAREEKDFRDLNDLALANIQSEAVSGEDVQSLSGKEKTFSVKLTNRGTSPALELKLTLLHADGTRVLPAYYSDNYVSLMPGEERVVTVNAPFNSCGPGALHFSLHGWNDGETTVAVGTH